MLDWYYHDPGQGRLGPFPAELLLARYRERRIGRDTLVWREGMREWQPLERADGIDISAVEQDARLPPPLPPVMPAAIHATPARGPRGLRDDPPKRMSGCLIALIVAAALAVPMLGILAAIAVPAYNDYLLRTKIARDVDVPAMAMRPAVEAAQARLGRCPGEVDELGAATSTAAEVRIGELASGQCAFEITLRGIDARVDGKTVLHVAPDAEDGDWDCTGGSLDARFRPAACRASSTDETP